MKGRINIREKYGQNTILSFPFPREDNTMKYKEISEKYKFFQTWEIGFPDQEGWFNISSQKAVNKYLTVTKIGNRNQLTMEEEGEFAVILFVRSSSVFSYFVALFCNLFSSISRR